jgi:hypothetical protein
MKKITKCLRRSGAIILLFAAHSSNGQSVTYVGSETGLPANGYSVQNWSNPGVAKAYDIGGSEVYGSAGYYQIRPTPNSSPTDVSAAVGGGNDLGILALSNPTLFSLPSFLSSATGDAGTFVNFGGYSIYRGPDGSALYRQGALSVAVNNGPFNSPAGQNASYFGTAMNFTLNSSVSFRLGLAVDSVGSGAYAPNYVGIYNALTGSVLSEVLTRDGNADMAFFDISGTGGDTFTVALWQNVGEQPGGQVAALSLVTYDVIPEPSAGLLAIFGLASLGALHAVRKRHQGEKSPRQDAQD